MIVSESAKKIYAALGLIALIAVSIFTGITAANAQSNNDGPTLIDSRCKKVVIIGDRDADTARENDMENMLRSGGIEEVEIIGGQGFNSRQLADEDIDTDESCVISMLGRIEMLNIGDSEQKGQVVVDRVEDKFPDSKIFWSVPVVKSTTNTAGLVDAVRSSDIDIMNFAAVAEDSDTENGELTEDGEQNFVDFVTGAFFQLVTVENEDGSSSGNNSGNNSSSGSNNGSGSNSDSGNNSGSNSGGNGSGSNSGGSLEDGLTGNSDGSINDPSASNSGSSGSNNSGIVPSSSSRNNLTNGGSSDGGDGSGNSNWNPDGSTNIADENPDAPYNGSKTITLDTDAVSPKAELEKAKSETAATAIMQDYSMLGRWGNDFTLPSSGLDMANPLGSGMTTMSNAFFSMLLKTGGTWTSFVVVELYPRAFSLDIMSSAMNSINKVFSGVGSSLFRFQDDASDNSLAHTGGIMGSILVLIIIFSAWKVLRSPWGSISQLLPSVVKASIGAVVAMALFVGMVYQAGKAGPGNGDGQAGNPMSWPALSPAWFISWGVGTANIVISTGTNIVMSALSQFGDNGTPDNPENAPSSCDRFQDSMYDIAFSSQAMNQGTGTNSTLLLKMDDLLGSPIVHAYAAMNGGNTLSSANTWCLSLESRLDRSGDSSRQPGQFALIGRGANYNVDALGGGSLASGGYASGNTDFGTTRTIPGGPERGGRYVDGEGNWNRQQGGTDSDGNEYEYIDYGYQGVVNMLGGLSNTAQMESTVFHAMCFWDPKTGNPVFNQEWNNVQYMNPRVAGETGGVEETDESGEASESGDEQSTVVGIPGTAGDSGNANTGANAQSDDCFDVTAPTHGTKTSGVGPRWGTEHNGLDIANDLGTPIVSATDGEVISAGPASGYGTWVRVQAPDGLVHIYGHMPSSSLEVSEGDTVKAGDKIAEIGSEGESTGPHLHWQIEDNGSIIDPEDWMRDMKIDESGDAVPASAFKDIKKSCDGSSTGRESDSGSSGDSGSDSGSSDGDSGSGSSDGDSGSTENGETESPSGEELPDGTRNYTSDDSMSDVFANKKLCNAAPDEIYYGPDQMGKDYGFGGPESTLSSKLNYTPRVKSVGDVVSDMATSLPGVSQASSLLDSAKNVFGKVTSAVGLSEDEHVDTEDKPGADDPTTKFEGAEKARGFWEVFVGKKVGPAMGAILMGGLIGILATLIFLIFGVFVLIIMALFSFVAMVAGLLAFALIFSLVRQIGKGPKGGK